MRTALGVLVGIAVCLTAGCGPTALKPRGRVLKDGAPFLPEEGTYVVVLFVPIQEGGGRAPRFFPAEFNPADATFQVVGNDGKGMPPGRYRVAVEHTRKKQDLLKGKFNAENSPFVREVQNSGDEIVIDLAKPKE